ncbi:MAG: cyanoexosortase A system-associated protein [Pseudanabaenaceae cyanobacterium bins.39]|nr:cyanoexosortase A system-associated protein [Pseudanabaenaceae cyanobacterium bins.39]
MSDSENNQVEEISANTSGLADQRHRPIQDKFRIALLGVLLTSALLILGKSLFDPNLGKPLPLEYPERIDLPSAQPLPLDLPAQIIDKKDFYNKPKYLSGHRYKYLVDGLSIDIDLRYAYRTNGDVFLFLKEFANIEFDADKTRSLISKNSLGYYFTFEHQDRFYLTACINPRGITTVTTEQFEENASQSALNQDVIIDWLLGRKDLRDRRCLWTLISTAKPTNGDAQDIKQKLEPVWFVWYEWWKNRFPNS